MRLLFRRQSVRWQSVSACMLGVALVVTPQTSASATTDDPSVFTHSAIPAPAPLPFDSALDVSSLGIIAETVDYLRTQEPPMTQGVCLAYTRGDYVHKSGSDASGHGWWDNVDCSATYADVTVQLQQYYSDGSWRNIGSPGTARVREGGGSGKRATGRVACTSSRYTGWRSVIDVDLVGSIDDSSKLATIGRNIYCRR